MSRFIPRGVAVGGLGKRFLAAVIDALPPALIGGALLLVWQLNSSPSMMLVTSIAASVLVGCYGLFQWWSYGSGGAGLGARAMGLRLVGLTDGEAIGWWRFFLRYLIFSALMATVVGGIAFLVFLVIHERRQGWHDLAVGAVVVQPKVAERRERNLTKKGAGASTVGLPPHLSSAFSPQPGSSSQNSQAAPAGSGWGSYSPPTEPMPTQARPSWLPQLEPEPVAQPARSQAPSGGVPGPGAMPPGQAQAPFGGQPVAPAQPRPQGQPSAASFPAAQPSAPTFPQGQSSSASFPAAQPSASQPPAAQPQQPRSSAPGGATSPRPVNQGWIPLPTPSSIIAPATPEAPRIRPREFGEVDDDEGTRIAKPAGGSGGARAGGEGWYLRLDDGREVELTVPVLLGRNPQKSEGDRASHLVPAGGDGRMISRTHVLIDTDPRGVFVMDRGSTNGTALVTPAGELEPCPSDTQVRVREGQQVSYGNRWFTVLRRPEPLRP